MVGNKKKFCDNLIQHEKVIKIIADLKLNLMDQHLKIVNYEHLNVWHISKHIKFIGGIRMLSKILFNLYLKLCNSFKAL